MSQRPNRNRHIPPVNVQHRVLQSRGLERLDECSVPIRHVLREKPVLGKKDVDFEQAVAATDPKDSARGVLDVPHAISVEA